MGNICGKSESENFSQPGRVLGSAPSQPDRASVPNAAARVGGPPRTLGGTPSSAEGQRGGDGGGGGGGGPNEARRRAAEAAEARASAQSAAANKGKLGTQLAAQKKQTRNDTLKEISESERRQRDADEAADARTHN